MTLTNKCRINLSCPYAAFSGVSRMNFKNAVIFKKKCRKKLKNYLFLFVLASPIFRGGRMIKELMNLAFAVYQNYSDLSQLNN